MTGLPKSVRDGLAAQQHAATEHPDADILTAFAEDALTAAERGSVMEHLARCPTCREVVALSTNLPTQEATHAVVPGRSSWWNWSILRWAAPVAAVIVVGAAVMLHDYRESRQTSKVGLTTTAHSDVQESRSEDRKETETKMLPRRESVAPGVATPSQVGASRTPSKARRAGEGPSLSARVDEPASTPAAYREKQLAGKSEASSGMIAGSIAQPRQGTDKLAPEVDTVTVGSAIKDQASPAGRMVAPAAPAVEAGEKKSKEGGYATTVEAQSAAAPVNADTAEAASDLPKKALTTTRTPEARSDEMLAKGNAANYASNQAFTPAPAALAWRVADGHLSRSYDRRNWIEVPFAGNPKITAFSSVGPHLWVGAERGVLFHSSDNGQTWNQVQLLEGEKPVRDAVSEIAFSDVNSGVVTTASGGQWITRNAGQSWSRRD